MLDSKDKISVAIKIATEQINKMLEMQSDYGIFGRSFYFLDDLKPLPKKQVKVVLSKSKTEQIVKSRYKQIKLYLQNRSVPFLSNALLWAEAAHYKSRLM
jgi:hypothetical protein